MATEKKPKAKAKPATGKAASAKSSSGRTGAAPARAASKNGVAKVKPDPGKVQSNGKSAMKDEFANLKEKAGQQAKQAADRGKERASEALGGFGKILRDSAQTIDERVGAEYGDYARKAADAVDDFAGKMDAKQVEEIVEDARQFVRKSPAVAIGAAAAIGFILARMVRSGRDA